MQTNRIKLAPGAHLLPYHHPAEFACRVAFMDHLAQGRYMFGVGASGTAASKAYLARISTLLPDIRERAAEVERLGRVSDDTIRALTDAGVFRAVQPRRWGGLELDPASFFEGMVRIASACASTGWVASVVGVHAWHVSMFSEEAQREVWQANADARISSTYAPTGKVRRVDSGFQLRLHLDVSSTEEMCRKPYISRPDPKYPSIPT